MPKRPRAGNARHCRMNRLGLINCAAAAAHFIPAIRRTGSYDLTKRAAAIQRIPPTGSGATRALAQQLSHAGRRYPRPSLCRSSRQRAGARRTLYGTFHCATSLGYKKSSSKSILGFLLFRYAYLAIFYLISCRVVSGKTPSPPSQTLAYIMAITNPAIAITRTTAGPSPISPSGIDLNSIYHPSKQFTHRHTIQIHAPRNT